MYGFPFTALTMYMWYRKDLAEDPKEKKGFKAKYGYELQPAKTWKQYRDLAEWFTRPEQGFYGTALQGKRHEALWYEWLNFLYSFGGDMMEVETGSECGPIIVNSPEAIASLEYYKSLMKYSPPDTLNYFWDDVMALMQQSKVFELIMWNDATYAVAQDTTVSQVVGKMGFDLVPQGDRRQGRPGRGLDLSHPDLLQEPGGGVPVHPVDDGVSAAARAAPERRRVGAPRRVRRSRGPEAALRQGLDADQRGRQSRSRRSRSRRRSPTSWCASSAPIWPATRMRRRRSIPRRSRCTTCLATAPRCAIRPSNGAPAPQASIPAGMLDPGSAGRRCAILA